MHAIGVHQKAVADNLEREAKELEELVPMCDALDDPGNDASEAESDRQSVVEVCGRWKAKGGTGARDWEGQPRSHEGSRTIDDAQFHSLAE